MESKKFSRIVIPRSTFYLWIIFFLLVALAFLNKYIAVIGSIILVFLIYYNYRSNYLRQKELTKYIENLTFNIDSATKDTLLNFPMPLALFELDSTMIWKNPSFKRIFGDKNSADECISNFISGLSPQRFEDKKASIEEDIKINGRYYKVLGNFVKTKEKSDVGSYILMLYFIDNTELVETKSLYENERVAVGLVIIDNYDDLMQSMEDASRPQMLAEIDKRVVSSMGYTKGILKKFERDKYLFIFRHRFLKEFEDKKFEILDIVKDINTGNKIPVTLSIGFGINGETLLDNIKAATTSIDIALGRGGDQVVIKDNDDLRFYGGKTRELEKRTRVKARVISYALRELIDQAPMVMIMGHENPDVDSLGAALGIYRIVKCRGKEAFIILNNSNPSIENLMTKLQKSPDHQNMFMLRSEALDRIDKKTLLVVVDTHRPSFTECPGLIKATNQVVIIDHHRRGAEFVQDAVLTYQETYASSTCELVTEILQYVDEKVKLTPVEVEALFAGIVVDTKNFTFKTGVRTFEAASYLRRNGVDTVLVRQLFQNDLETYINRANVVRNAEIINESIAISACPPNTKNSQLITAQAADELLSLTGVTAAFVLSTDNNIISISGRSLGDINVQVILEKLGGGGHLTVAGAQLDGVSMEQAQKMLKKSVSEYLDGLNVKSDN